jgi:hypothetical protein
MTKNGILVGTAEVLPATSPRRKKVKEATVPSLFAPVPTNGPYDTRDNREKLMIFLRGFRDGAGASAYRHPTESAYLKGYEEGSKARAGAVKTFCEEIEHDPFQDILRCSTENAPENRR